MKERLTITISAENKKFIKQHARSQNESVSKFIDDLLASFIEKEREKNKVDKRFNKSRRAYSSGKKDVLAELFAGIEKRINRLFYFVISVLPHH